MIDQEQLHSFQNNGYLHLKNVLTSEQVTAWRDRALSLEKTLQPDTAINAFFTPQGELGRANELMRYFPDEIMNLIALQPILDLAHTLCGEDVVPLNTDLLIKRKGPLSAINWHQDAIYDRTFPIIVIGIYLDDSQPQDGEFQIIEGSHFEKQNIAQVTSEADAVKSIPVNAGDILVHDAMVLHCSGEKRQPEARRTIYLEMRPYQAIINEGIQSHKWADLRRWWMQLALQKAEPSWSKKFTAYSENISKNRNEFLREILNEFSPQPPAHYG